MSRIFVKKLGSLSVVDKDRPSKYTSFFSLPGEFRNQIYQYYAAELGYMTVPEVRGQTQWNFNIRRLNDKNVLTPRIPALMQTSKQIRSEFVVLFDRQLHIKCSDYSSFYPWSQGLGKSLVANFQEIHLKIKVNVNLVPYRDKNGRQKQTLANLRFRYNGTRHSWDKLKGLTVRFWYDMIDNSNAAYLVGQRGDHIKENDNKTPWTIMPADLDKMSHELEARLPWDRHFTVDEVLQLAHWMSGDGLISFYVPSPQNLYSKAVKEINTFTIEHYGNKRVLTAVWYPPGSCEGCTSSQVLWEKPVAVEDTEAEMLSRAFTACVAG